MNGVRPHRRRLRVRHRHTSHAFATGVVPRRASQRQEIRCAGARGTRLHHEEKRRHGGGQGEGRAYEREGPKTGDECVVERAVHRRGQRRVEARRDPGGSELGPFAVEDRARVGRQRDLREGAVARAVEGRYQNDPQAGDGEQARGPRHGVVDARRGAGVALGDRAEDGRRERRHGDAHPDAQERDRGQERTHVRAAGARDGQASESGRGDQRADRERPADAVARRERARRATENGDEHHHREKRRTGLRRGIPLNGDEIERQKEEAGTERGVEKEGRQVRRRERPRAEEPERHHRRSHLRFDRHEGREERAARDECRERARGA